MFMWKAGFVLSSAWQTELEDTLQPATGESSVGWAGARRLTVLLQKETRAHCSEASLQARVKCSQRTMQNKRHTDLQAATCSQG